MVIKSAAQITQENRDMFNDFCHVVERYMAKEKGYHDLLAIRRICEDHVEFLYVQQGLAVRCSLTYADLNAFMCGA